MRPDRVPVKQRNVNDAATRVALVARLPPVAPPAGPIIMPLTAHAEPSRRPVGRRRRFWVRDYVLPSGVHQGPSPLLCASTASTRDPDAIGGWAGRTFPGALATTVFDRATRRDPSPLLCASTASTRDPDAIGAYVRRARPVPSPHGIRGEQRPDGLSTAKSVSRSYAVDAHTDGGVNTWHRAGAWRRSGGERVRNLRPAAGSR
jgi:hypothetical protein